MTTREIKGMLDEDGYFERGIFCRVHWSDCPEFSAENAYSRPWGEDDAEPLLGYSCCTSPKELIDYFSTRTGGPDGETVVIFRGKEVGFGPDGESLAVPSEGGILGLIDYKSLRAEFGNIRWGGKEENE